jgi:hypothetical protein
MHLDGTDMRGSLTSLFLVKQINNMMNTMPYYRKPCKKCLTPTTLIGSEGTQRIGLNTSKDPSKFESEVTKERFKCKYETYHIPEDPY